MKEKISTLSSFILERVEIQFHDHQGRCPRFDILGHKVVSKAMKSAILESKFVIASREKVL